VWGILFFDTKKKNFGMGVWRVKQGVFGGGGGGGHAVAQLVEALR